jgi:ABC-type glycerol-3-phosphate transport system substrate-binding protein
MAKRLLLGVLALTLIAAVILVGCAVPPPPEAAAPEPAETEEMAAKPSEAPSEDPLRAYEGTTLTVALKQGYETTAIENYVEDFEDLTGINVEYEVYDEPTLRNKFVLDATSKTGTYDVVAVQFWYFPEYDKAGWLEPLDDLMDVTSISGLADLDEVPDSVKASFVGSDGKLYAVPVSAAGGVLTYRTDVLDELGISEPESVKDVVEAAPKVVESKPDMFAWVGRGESSFASFSTSAGWAWAYGARVLNDEYNVTVDTPEMLEAMTDFVALSKEYGPPDQASLGWDAETPIFCEDGGKAVFNFEMSGFPGFWGNPENCGVADKIDMTVLTGPAGNAPQWFYAESLGISKFSDNKEAALLFLLWRMSPEILMKEVQDGIRLDIPYNAILNDPAYIAKAEESSLDWYVAGLPEVFDAVDMDYWPAVPEFVKVAEAFQSEISLAIAGEITVEDALANAQANIERIMEEAGY